MGKERNVIVCVVVDIIRARGKSRTVPTVYIL